MQRGMFFLLCLQEPPENTYSLLGEEKVEQLIEQLVRNKRLKYGIIVDEHGEPTASPDILVPTQQGMKWLNAKRKLTAR